MNDQNQMITIASEEQTSKRKRGRPPKDTSVHLGNSVFAVQDSNESSDEDPPNAVTEDNLLGQPVSGILCGSFDAGYFVTVKPQNSNTTLTGLVFCPEKVLPIVPENDLAPKEIMYKRISNVNEHDFHTPKPVDRGLGSDTQVPSTSTSKSDSKNAALMVECDPDASFTLKGNELSDQGYEFQMGSYYYPPVESLQDYRIVDHDEIMKEFEASACMNAPSASASKPGGYNLETISELQNVYQENLVNNAAAQNQDGTTADPCLKLLDTANPSEAVASFDVNKRPSVYDTTESQTKSSMLLDSTEPVRSDLQLGFTEAEYSTSADVYHSNTEEFPSSSVGKKNLFEKSSEPPFFFNLTDASNKSVTESLNFTLGNSQQTTKINDSAADKLTKEEAVSSELKLSASVTVKPHGSIPSGDAPRTETDT